MKAPAKKPLLEDVWKAANITGYYWREDGMTESVERQVRADLGAWVRRLAHNSDPTMV
jgi:hypothetical protein